MSLSSDPIVSWKERFDKSPIVLLFIGLLMIAALFFFLHMKSVRVDILELDRIAPKYVVSQVDFEFLDHEESQLLKREAAKSIGPIYRIKPKEIQERRLLFEKNRLHHQVWKKNEILSTYEELFLSVQMLSNKLLLSRFTDAATFEKIQSLPIVDKNYFIFTPPYPLKGAVFFPEELWLRLKMVSFSEHLLPPGGTDYLINYFKDKSWQLEEDLERTHMLRQAAMAQIPSSYRMILAGSRLIDQGEKVTATHVNMLKAMQEKLEKERKLWHPLSVIGSLLIAIVITLVGSYYIHEMHGAVYASNRKLLLLTTIVIITLLFAKLAEYFFFNSLRFIDMVRYPLFVPFATMLVCSLLNFRLALFTGGFLVIVLALGLQIEEAGGFFLVNVITSLVAILSMTTFHKRREVFVVFGKAWLAAALIVLALDISDYSRFGMQLAADLSSTFIFMLATAILVIGILPLLEHAFGVITDVTLMEYMDPTHFLLKRLMLEAPGTYQHSVVVGNLAEAAALSIGANALFCRVACQYHDIGKLVAPHYFSENQQGPMNMHQLLTPQESAEVIISHVTEGVRMAKQAKLPASFIAIIEEHHGTSLVYYFYHKEVARMAGDRELVDEKLFRYPGPKPRSKESAIIMIADSLEAAARSLDDFSEESVTTLIERLVLDKSEDGQFSDCQLTFEELKMVKEALIRTLVATSHSRIKYPSRIK